jgi:hypothetical protein
MEMDFLTVMLILLGLAVVWTVLRAVLKLTARLFALGCISLVLLVGAIWLLTTII